MKLLHLSSYLVWLNIALRKWVVVKQQAVQPAVPKSLWVTAGRLPKWEFLKVIMYCLSLGTQFKNVYFIPWMNWTPWFQQNQMCRWRASQKTKILWKNQIADAWCWTFEKDNSDINFFVFQSFWSLQSFFLTSEKSSLMHMMHLNTKIMTEVCLNEEIILFLFRQEYLNGKKSWWLVPNRDPKVTPHWLNPV